MEQSIADGKIETLDKVQTIADGIAVKTPGNLTYDLVSKYVDGIVTVTDDEIALAILTLLEQHKLIAEGAGAVPVAAVLTGKIPNIEGKNVCCLVSGGNIDVTILSRVIERGLKMSGRTASITMLFRISRVSCQTFRALLQKQVQMLQALIMTVPTLI